jgi:hypothetical protein
MLVRFACAAGLIAVALAASHPASAQPGNPAAEAACTGDAQRLCNQYIPDRRRVAACMSRNRSALSPGCRAFFGKGKARGKSKRRARR